MELLKDISNCVLKGDADNIEEVIQKALDNGVEVNDILDNGLLSGMDEVSSLFKAGDMFVPEVLMSAKAMDIGMQKIKPILGEGGGKKSGLALMLTVKGDLHDIGKKLVSVMLESAGFEIIDLGTDVTPSTVCEAVKKYNPDLIGMSAMLTTTMAGMKDTVETLKENGLYENLKVMVGGAPLNTTYAEQINAFYSPDSAGAVELALELMHAS